MQKPSLHNPFGYPIPRQTGTPCPEQNGNEPHDPFAWLADYRTNPDAKAYLEAQSAYTDAYFAASGIEPQLEAEFEALTYGGVERNIGTRRGDKTYYTRNDPHDEHAKLVVSEANDERVLIDVNTMEKGTSLMWFNVSPDGANMVYSLMKHDREEPSVFLYDLTSNEASLFYEGDHFLMDWGTDSAGFSYATSHGRTHRASRYFYQKLHHHTLGEQPQDDTLLLDAAQSILGHDVLLGFDRSDDGAHMLVNAHKRNKNIDTYLLDTQTSEIVQLFPEVSGRNNCILLDGWVYVHIDGKDDQRIVRMPLAEAADRPLAEWQDFVPNRPDHYIKSYDITKSNVVVDYAHMVDSKVVLFDRQTGQETKRVTLPAHSGLRAVRASRHSDVFDYSIGSAITRQKVYRYNGAESQLLHSSHHNLNPDEYETVKRVYESDDGTKVPIYFAAARGVIEEQDAPIIIDCHGGFMNGAFPEGQYTNLYRTWMAMGRIVAFPCVRGGNEFGKGWHQQALGEYKYKTIEDINAAARHIEDNEISSRIGLSGGSNGGAMVLAAMLCQPQSYTSVEARVPLADMLAYTSLPGTVESWTDEFGDPRIPKEREWLRVWSPYHAVKSGVEYPAVLLTAGLNDTRVDAAHALKMAAKMQQMSPNSRTLLHINPDSGHGHGMSASQWHAYYARRLAFHILQLT